MAIRPHHFPRRPWSPLDEADVFARTGPNLRRLNRAVAAFRQIAPSRARRKRFGSGASELGRSHVLAALALVLCSFVPAYAQNPFSDDARQTYAIIKSSVLRAAEKMPAENYAFRTVPQVRTYGEMIAHIADAQLRMCATVKGENVTANAASKTTKDDLVTALKASFDYCDPVYASMTDAVGAQKIRWARWDMSKLGLLNWNISHDNEMYGILGAFLRIKGIVPPSSEGRP
jgi:hypothetical protein